MHNDQNNVCGFHLDKFSRTVQFMICSVLTFTLYLLYGYIQEALFRIEGFKSLGMFLTLVQFGLYAVFGIVQQKLQNDNERRIPLGICAWLAVLTIGTMGLSNTAVGYLNYPTHIVFKSSKLIPVMIGGIIIQGKTYKVLDFIACIMMTLGLICFTLTDQSVLPNFQPVGVILICLALCSDAVIGNVQELVLKKYQASTVELVFYSYGIGFGFLLLGHAVSGQLIPGISFVYEKPQVLSLMFLFSLTGYVGILFVLQLVRSFGALPAVMVTTCRKAVTMVLSFVIFTKPFTIRYVWSGLMVLLGIFLNLWSKTSTIFPILNSTVSLKSFLFPSKISTNHSSDYV